MTDNAPTPPWKAAACASAGVFLLYVLTLAPTTAWWDTSEYIATGYTLGIPHPPGNPLFVTLARVWSLLLAPLGLSPAVRINLLAAATSAGAFYFFFLIAHRTLVQVGARGREALVGAGVSVLVGATTFTVWSQSNANEKVYTVSLLIVAAVSWLVLRWRDLPASDPRGKRMLVAAVYLMALGSTNHLMSVLPAGAVFLFVVLARPGVLVRPRFVSRCGLAVVVGLSFSFFLPIRAAQRPVINEGDPLCDGFVEAAAAIYTNGYAGCPALASSLQREQYLKPPVTTRMSPIGHQLYNFYQYFDWQWSRGMDPDEQVSPARSPFTLLFLVLGLAGFYVVWRADRYSGVYMAALMATLSFALVFYLNFRYGFSLAPEITNPDLHEVRERDYFFLLGFALWGVVSGLGLARCWLWLAGRMGSAIKVAPVLAVAAIPFVLNVNWANRAGDRAARDWAYDLLNSVEPYALLFTNGDNDTFPLWYLQEVEGIRKDVTVIVVQYLFTDWYPKQIRELTSPDRQRPYLAVDGLPFADREPPARSAVALTDDQLAQVGDGRLPDTLNVRLGDVVVQYPAGMTLRRGHRVALAMIRLVAGDRPVYFAGATGEMARMGLSGWGVREGLAVRLHPRDLEGPQPPSYRKVREELGGDWFDYPRTARLVDEVYTYRDIRTRPILQDMSTRNIPLQFYIMTAKLAVIATEEGDAEAADRYGNMSTDFLAVYQGGTEAPRTR
ncbi:MAG: DUF2723 domain-containing protein [Gemmatimonadetes bacterium]|nr:DUF2723 domain-containing protein [Gemmatimonadota bacterium]MYJ11571.1 DUF2723 domain-containing protein [Gemmatimonadota bacterium]